MFIKVRVIANSKQEKIEKTAEGYKVHLKEKPIHGKANKELIKLLSEYLDVKKENLVIKKGHSSNNKIVEILR